MTWSVRGIDEQARERALEEAKRSGLSVGDWLNSVILDSAVGKTASQNPIRRSSEPDRPAGDARGVASRATVGQLNENHDIKSLTAAVGRLAENTRFGRRGEAPRTETAIVSRAVAAESRDSASIRRSPEIPAADTRRGSETRQAMAANAGPRVEDLLETLDALDRRLRGMTDETKRPAKTEPEPRPAISNPSDFLTRAVEEMSRRKSMPMPDPEPETPPRAERGSRRDRQQAVPTEPSTTDLYAHAQATAPTPTPTAAVSARPTASMPTGDGIERHFQRLATMIDGLAQREVPGIESLTGEIRLLRASIEHREGGPSARDAVDLKDLAAKVDDLARRQPGHDRIQALVDEVADLRTIVERSDFGGTLKGIEAGYVRIADQLGDLKEQIADNDLGRRLDRGFAEVKRTVDAAGAGPALAAIEDRLDDLAQQVALMAGSGATEAMKAELASLRRTVSAFEPGPILAAVDDRLKRLAEKVETIERQAKLRADAPDKIEQLIDDVRKVASDNRTVEHIRALDRRFGEMADQLDAIERRTGRSDDVAMLVERIGSIMGKIEKLERSGLGGDDMAELIRRVSDLSDRIERGPSQMDTGSVGMIASALQTIDDHLQEKTGAIFARLDRLEAAVPSLPGADALGDIGRMLRRIDAQIADGLNANPMQAFEERIARLTATLDRAEPNAAGPEFARLGRDIAELRQQLAASLKSQRNEGLEMRIEELARTLESVAQPSLGDGALGMIEEKLTHIARQLQSTEARVHNFSAVHDTIAEMREILADRQDETLEAARQAARDAVRELNGFAQENGSEAALRALQAEVRALQNGNRANEGATAEMLRSVHEALSSVLHRLDGSEARPASMRRADPVHDDEDDDTDDFRPAIDRMKATLDDNRPLEPGTGKPAYSAAPASSPPPGGSYTPRDIFASQGEDEGAPAKRADFIAAARRAAQAARSSEPASGIRSDLADNQHDDLETDAGKGPLARIGAMLRGNRRPLVMAAAAILLAVFALEFVVGRGGSNTAEVAQATKTPVATTVASAGAPIGPARTQAATPGRQGGAGQITIAQGNDPALMAPSGVATTFGDAASTASIGAGGGMQGFTPRGSNEAALASSDPNAGKKAPDATRVDMPATAPMPLEKVGSIALRQAASRGDAKAQFEVGLRFAEGRGVPVDPKEAAAWYKRAAEQGLAPAQYRIGSAYEKGFAGVRDTAEAKRWYAAAADRGNIRAMHNLGVLFANDRDMTNAVPWFQKAADSGVRYSQFNLGIIYALGSGVKQDLAVSYKWFALAAAQGDQDAAKKRDDVAAHLEKPLLASSKMAVQTWRQKSVDRAANEEATVWIEPTGPAPMIGAAVGAQDDIGKIQSMLQSKGAYAGPIDGQLTAATRTAIKTFQRRAGLKQTGEIDQSFIDALTGRST
jgi:localization factor PodJL